LAQGPSYAQGNYCRLLFEWVYVALAVVVGKRLVVLDSVLVVCRFI